MFSRPQPLSASRSSVHFLQPLEQRRDLVRRQLRRDGEQQRGAGRDLRRRERRPLGVAVLVRAAARVALVAAGRKDARQRPRQRREEILARRGKIVVDGVAVGEERHRAVAGDRTDAEDMRQRRGIARVRPRRLRRLVAVADRRHENCAFPRRVVDGVGLDRREGVPVGIARVAHAAK
jgi:hypothetical protein